MTKDEAIACLRRYRRTQTDMPSTQLLGWKMNYEFERAVFERYLILELIGEIRQSDCSPMTVVQKFYYAMDDMVCTSESALTWGFASIMESCAADILRYLRAKNLKEKRRKNHEQD